MKKRIFIKKLSSAELGEARTHEKYIRLPNDFDYEEFFQDSGWQNNSVIQIDFDAIVKNDNESVAMKFVYYANSNNEKRIPSLGPIFDKYNASFNDIIYLECTTVNGARAITLSFLNSNDIKLFTSPISYVIEEQTKKQEFILPQIINEFPLQQIFFGAPGTGKSHTIEKRTKEQTEHVVRTTFHPDTDYATFVGAYKPTTKTIPVTTVIGTKAVPVEDAQGKPVSENKIVYEFVPQAFLQAYVAAWRAQLRQPAEAEYLVIEEINRGNCAQIFGDLFQLLDRTDSGFSEYPIKADTDMQRFLSGQFADLDIPHIEGLEDNVLTRVLSGEELVLPNNLFIWATMNTSDQSLFPIDSAFKRRWDWKYIPINNANLDYKIDVDGAKYDWWDFLTKINEKIGSATNSEDKKLGYFFCKADQEKNISAERFVSKVVFYLWNDVFKDLDESEVFRDGENGNLTFDKFYNADGGVNTEKVKTFLENLGLKPFTETGGEENDDEEGDDEGIGANGRNYDKFTINGGEECTKNRLAIGCIKEFIRLNPTMSASQVYDTWKPLANGVPHFIETQDEFDKRTDNSKRSDEIKCHGELLYVTHDGYRNDNGKADALMNLVNSKNWGITIKKIEK